MKNPDGSHFSVEENGFLGMYFILMISSLIFVILNIRKYTVIYKKESEHDWM